MKILTVCNFGQNRSVYLRDYLRKKGYDTEASGLRKDDLEERIAEADIIIPVQPEIEQALRERVDLSDKHVITLNVEDRPERVLPQKQPLDGKAWLDFQKHQVYAPLVEQLEKHLPFEEKEI